MKTSADVSDIAINLGRACLQRRTKTALNLGNIPNRSMSFSHHGSGDSNEDPIANDSSRKVDSISREDNFMIVSYPLIQSGASSSSPCKGVMQVVLSLPVNTR